MRIAVTGISEYTDLLVDLLTDKKHEVTFIGDDEDFCEHMAASHEVDVVLGNPCQEFIMGEAGIRNYDIVAALGREDADNLEICQMAKKLFGVRHAVCLVSNPRNVGLFEQLGVDQVMNVPQMMADVII